MDEYVLARVLHVLGVVVWIGGVAMVTSVILPVITQKQSAYDRIEIFRHIEKRFAWQARFTTLLVGLSGFYMVHILDAWNRFAELRYWWMHAMVLVWGIFILFLFILEPLVFRRQVKAQAQRDPEAVLARVRSVHWVLLSVSLITIAGAVAGSHGWVLSREW